jgi:hypothetical protein
VSAKPIPKSVFLVAADVLRTNPNQSNWQILAKIIDAVEVGGFGTAKLLFLEAASKGNTAAQTYLEVVKLMERESAKEAKS